MVDVVDDQLLTEHHTEGRSVDFEPHRYDQPRQGMTAQDVWSDKSSRMKPNCSSYQLYIWN